MSPKRSMAAGRRLDQASARTMATVTVGGGGGWDGFVGNLVSQSQDFELENTPTVLTAYTLKSPI